MNEYMTDSPRLRAARRENAKAIEQARPATLLQLSIILALAITSLIACMIWLNPS
jgi:hypothetical protein